MGPLDVWVVAGIMLGSWLCGWVERGIADRRRRARAQLNRDIAAIRRQPVRPI